MLARAWGHVKQKGESWELDRFWFSGPEGEIRTFYGSSLGGLRVQATMHI